MFYEIATLDYEVPEPAEGQEWFQVHCQGNNNNSNKKTHNQLVTEVRGIKIVSINNYHFMKLKCEGKVRSQRTRNNGEGTIYKSHQALRLLYRLTPGCNMGRRPINLCNII